LHRAPPQSLLLCPAPRAGLVAPTRCRRCTEILADMIKVAKKVSLFPKHFPALTPDPIGAVPHGRDLALQAPTGLAGRSVPGAVRFLPRCRKSRHIRWWRYPWLGPRAISFPSTVADVCPSSVPVEPCRSSSRRPGQSHELPPVPAECERAADIPPPALHGLFGHGPRWHFAPRWPQSQTHRAPAHFPRPGQRNARSQSPSAPAPIVSSVLVA
jgi:hypothetical protein